MSNWYSKNIKRQHKDQPNPPDDYPGDGTELTVTVTTESYVFQPENPDPDDEEVYAIAYRGTEADVDLVEMV